MFTRFDATKSTKGASKLRRDLINAEIANLRDLLPLPPSTRQRLSQLQLMALVCVYVRKANYFQQDLKVQLLNDPDYILLQAIGIQGGGESPQFLEAWRKCADKRLAYLKVSEFDEYTELLTFLCMPYLGYKLALSGFLMMMTQNGKLLYISDNAAEYLGHSMEDLLIHGDSMYDMIDKQDHGGIQSELLRSSAGPLDDSRIFLCRMNVSRNARRQMRFGDQKVVLVEGHYLSFLPLCSRNEPVFLATCTPVAMPETRECVVQGATNVFTSIHSMDMKFVHLDRNGEWHLGYPRSELHGLSWYQLLHWDCMREAQTKHRLISQSEQDRSCILLVRVQRRSGEWLWVHTVLQVKENLENSQQPLIVATNQVLSESEACVMRANSWLYHYYTVQSKLQYGLGYEATTPPGRPTPTTPGPTTTPAAPTTPAYYQQGPATPSPYHHDALPPPPYHHQLSPHHHPHPPPQPHISPHEHFRYGRRSEPEPVDYSVNHQEGEMKTELSPRSSPASIVDLDSGGGGGGGGGGGTTVVALQSSGGGGGGGAGFRGERTRHLVKGATLIDPTDVMEQWNPSPPWSDTTLQKVPDILHQDLSPYVTTTPPTPGSGVSYHQPPTPAFTFDWPPEQYVPVPPPPVPPPVLEQEHQTLLAGCFSWHHGEHRLFPLQPPPRPVLRLAGDEASPPVSGGSGGPLSSSGSPSPPHHHRQDHLLLHTIKDERPTNA